LEWPRLVLHEVSACKDERSGEDGGRAAFLALGFGDAWLAFLLVRAVEADGVIPEGGTFESLSVHGDSLVFVRDVFAVVGLVDKGLDEIVAAKLFDEIGDVDGSLAVMNDSDEELDLLDFELRRLFRLRKSRGVGLGEAAADLEFLPTDLDGNGKGLAHTQSLRSCSQVMG